MGPSPPRQTHGHSCLRRENQKEKVTKFAFTFHSCWIFWTLRIVSKRTYGTLWFEAFWITTQSLSPWAFCLFRLNQQVEMGQTYLSTVGQPGARSDNVTPVQGQEGSVVGAYLLQIHVFGALKERCVRSETDRNRHSLFLAEQLATGTSLLLSHSQSSKSQCQQGPATGAVASSLVTAAAPSLQGRSVEPLCGMMQSAENGEENWDRKCYFSPYCQGQGLLRAQV